MELKSIASIISILLLPLFGLFAQKMETITTHDNVSFRGLCITENCIWVSGGNGTIGRSLDGGKTWQWQVVTDYEHIDFRDIEAFDANTAIIMGVASPAYILKTIDGGKNWTKVFEHKHPDIFLDAMAFKNKKEGIVIGDPIDGKIFVAATEDGGNSWHETRKLNLPKPLVGEAFFAASGSNIISDKKDYALVSGGKVSRIFYRKNNDSLPTTKGGTMTGANSIAIQSNTILVASGNYEQPNNQDSCFIYSLDAGKSWKLPDLSPGGYRSCVCFTEHNTAVTCGTSGVDISYDNGKTWKNISKQSFNTCAFDKVNNFVYLVGNNGRLGKLVL